MPLSAGSFFEKPRTARERGVAQRFNQNDIGLEVKLTSITIPLTTSTGAMELVDWPVILPHGMVAKLKN